MSKATQAVAADHIFDGTAIRRKSAVLIAGEDILGIVAVNGVPRGTPLRTIMAKQTEFFGAHRDDQIIDH